MPVDLEKYRPYLDGHDMTDEQKDECIRAVWKIMESFADQAWGLHPVQLATAARDSDPRGTRDRKPRRGRSQ